MKNNKIFLLLVFISYCVVSNGETTDGFRLFDATLYSNKVNLSGCDFEPIKVIYESEIFKNKDIKEPKEEEIKALAKKYINYKWVIFDIEKWDQGGESILDNTDLYIKFIKVFKKYNETSKIGYYGVLPIRDYWRASHKKGVEKYNDWKRDTLSLIALADSVDAIFPSIYTFYTDKAGWADFARSQIEMAKLLSKGKPVYPFIWPNYHDSNYLLSYRYIGDDYWEFQLKTIKKHTDGAIVWGGWSHGYGRPKQWKTNMDWWVSTKKFLNKSDCDER